MNAIAGTLTTIIKNWWWLLIKGLLLIGAGVVIFAKPQDGYAGLSVLISVVIIAIGFSQIFFSVANKAVLNVWGWTLVSGILDVVIGAYLFSYPVITMVTLPFILGFWLIFKSFHLMGASFDLKILHVDGWGWLLFGGIVVAVLGFVVLYYPAAGAISIVAFTGSAFIVAGIFNLMLAYKLKNIKAGVQELEKRF
jgi:uncharacterized membrane protein HdeD (DUF308 family)